MSHTLYAKKAWFAYLREHCFESSAYGGSLVRMRRSLWGDDAYVVRCSKHLFRVDKETFDHIKEAAE